MCHGTVRQGIAGPMVAFGALLVLAAGCATRAKVERHQPAAYNAGTARTLSLVQVTGRPDLQGLVRKALRREAAASDWWTFRNAINDKIAIFPDAAAGRSVRGRQPAEREVFVRMDAYDAQVFPEKHKHGKKHKSKREDPPASGMGRVRVRFAATVVGSAGRVLMREREYAGTADGDIGSRFRRGQLVDKAAREGMERFLEDITPRRVREGIVLDKDAEDMAPVAELVAHGRYAEAMDRLKSMRARHPRRADVVYNMAVLTDARGEYEAALALYRQALQRGYKSYYVKSRDACERRLRDRNALSR